MEEQKESSAARAPQREKHVAAMHRLMAALQSPTVTNAPIVTQKGVVACSDIAPQTSDIVLCAAARLGEQAAVIRQQRETINHTSGFHGGEILQTDMPVEGLCNASGLKRAKEENVVGTFGEYYQARRDSSGFCSSRDLSKLYVAYNNETVEGKCEASAKRQCIGLLRPEVERVDDGTDDVSTASLYPDVMELIMSMTTGKYPGPAEVTKLVESTPMC